jgi:hypothetical protein
MLAPGVGFAYAGKTLSGSLGTPLGERNGYFDATPKKAIPLLKLR